MRFDWDWEFALRILPHLLDALCVTVSATAGGFVLAALLGLVFALLRRSRARLVSWLAACVIEFVRSTPLLIQIYFLFYVMPGFGLRLPPFTTGVLALGLHYAAYTSEVYRAGIEAVPKGQWEAARALNMRPLHIFRSIILPQAIRLIVPALGNYLVAMFKDTPMLSAITVLELLYRAKDIASETFRYLEPLTLVGVLFLLVSLLSAALVRHAERRLALP